jgi:hypothetical protein
MKLGYRINWIIVLVALFLALPAAAQNEGVQFNRIQIDVWPDFDRAAVLVLITGELPAGTAFPTTVQFRLPAAAGEPHAVAQITDTGEMLNASYETQSDGDAILVTVEASGRNIRIEYYFPYDRNGEQVNLTYQWLGGVAADEFTVYFQEPVGSSGVSSDSGFEDIGVQDDGRRYRRWPVGAIDSDDTLAVSFSYSGPLPSPPSTTTLPPAEEKPSVLPVAIAAGGGSLIGIGAGWYLASQRAPVHRAPRRQARAKTVYCRQCGERLKTDDAFCRQCGARAR